MVDEVRLPAWPRPLHCEVFFEGTEHNRQFIVSLQVTRDVETIRAKHVVSRQNAVAVEPDFGKRGEPVEAEKTRLAGSGFWRSNICAIPPIGCVQIKRLAKA